jgi:hypothetical protein
MRQADIPSLLNEAYGRADTVANAQSAFRTTGIWPVDRHVFQEHRFAPVAVLLPADTAQPSSCETQKTVTTVAKMKITNHLVRE